MQGTENEEKQSQVVPADPESQRLDDSDHDGVELLTEAEAREIFANAVAELDTQPLFLRREPFTIGEVLEICLLVSVLCFSFMGIVWQCITYPHTLVVLYTKARPAQITTTLDLPTRTVAPVTITRSATTLTTGRGHQEATQATGTLIFYNGSATSQDVPSGSVFTGNDRVKVTTVQSITVPAANLPAIGSLPVQARAALPGSHGNIAAFDINSALSTDLKVRNEAPFNKGRDARNYQAVASADLNALTSTVNETLSQAFLTAFPLQSGEQAFPTQCHSTTTANHQSADEAQSVTLTISKTCSAIAYNRQQVEHLATAAFTQTRPTAHYHLIGSVLATIQRVSPFSVTIHGTWAYTFSTDYEQDLAEHIAGDTPEKANAYLLSTSVVSSASVPSVLPPAMYIDFLVLVG